MFLIVIPLSTVEDSLHCSWLYLWLLGPEISSKLKAYPTVHTIILRSLDARGSCIDKNLFYNCSVWYITYLPTQIYSWMTTCLLITLLMRFRLFCHFIIETCVSTQHLLLLLSIKICKYLYSMLKLLRFLIVYNYRDLLMMILCLLFT